jgi:predicted aconitase with swiveling domain
MILTDEEKAMRDGAEGAAVAAAMDLLIRYGQALDAERLCDVRNVAGTMTQPSPVKAELVKQGLVFPSAKGSSGWAGFFQSTRLLGTAPIGMIITRISSKSALGAVVTRVPAVTDLDQDPCQVIQSGDRVRIDNGTVEVIR